MGYFPFYVNVERCHGVVVGGGHIAADKIRRLLRFGGKLTVVAPAICDEIKQCGEQVELIEHPYEDIDLDGADYVIAATNDTALNERVYRDAKAKHLLINVVDAPERCDFIFPSVMQRGRLVVGVSTSGSGPQVSRRIRDTIEDVVPDNIEEILDILAKERQRAKEEIPDRAERRKYLMELADELLGYEKQDDTGGDEV